MKQTEFEKFLDKCMPKMSKNEQIRALKQIVRYANEESRKEALRDPLSKIPMA